MSASLNYTLLLAQSAQAKLLIYESKFVDARVGLNVAANDYLRPYIHVPEGGRDPGVQKVRYPIPLNAPKLRPFKGRRHFAKNSTAYVDIDKSPFDYGEHEYYETIAAFDWVGFNRSPERLAYISATWISENGCNLINAAESHDSWNGVTFANAAVPRNPFKRSTATYKTLWSATALTHDNVLAMRAEMGTRRGFANDNLGLEGDTIFASPELTPLAEQICYDERLANGQTNPVKKYNLKVEKWIHLSAPRWGLIHKSAMADYPLFGALEGEEMLRVLGEDSAMFETTLHMGYHLIRPLGINLLRQEAFSLASTTPVS